MKPLRVIVFCLLFSCSLLAGEHFPQGEDSVTTYWPNGQMKEHYRVALHPERDEGDTTKVKIGLYRAWHENGQLAEECEYNFGQCEGLFTSWYSNGQIHERGNCVYKRQGVWFRWFENGDLAEMTEYSAGEKVGHNVGWTNGDPARCSFDLHYDDLGRLHGHCIWAACPEHRAWHGFYWEGRPLITLEIDDVKAISFFTGGSYYNDSLGLWVVWDDDWQHFSTGKAVNGHRVGIWTQWNPNRDVFKIDYSKYCDSVDVYDREVLFPRVKNR